MGESIPMKIVQKEQRSNVVIANNHSLACRGCIAGRQAKEIQRTKIVNNIPDAGPVRRLLKHQVKREETIDTEKGELQTQLHPTKNAAEGIGNVILVMKNIKFYSIYDRSAKLYITDWEKIRKKLQQKQRKNTYILATCQWTIFMQF